MFAPRSVILRLLLALMTVAGCLPSFAAGDDPLWEDYKSRFVTADGRVVDTGNDGASHSEGQGYGMLLAVHYDDRPTFDALWTWTHRNLGIRHDGLFVWHYRPDERNPTADPSNATDGDLLITWALARAAVHWNDDGYREIARDLARTLRSTVVSEAGHEALLLPGVDWAQRENTTVLNPSYWIFPAFKEIAAIDPDPVWGRLTRSGLRLIEEARFGTWDLPADWLAALPEGGYAQADDFPFVFGYDAMRIPLYYLWAGYDRKDILRVYQAFWAATARGNQLVTMLGLATDRIHQQESVLAFRAVDGLVACALTGEPADVLNNTLHKYDDYFSSTLFLIARMAADEALPQCRPGNVAAAGFGRCAQPGDPGCALPDPIPGAIRHAPALFRISDRAQVADDRRRPLAEFTAAGPLAGTPLLYLATRDGRIRLLEDGRILDEPLLDLARLRTGSFTAVDPDTGLLAVALHPDFARPQRPGYRRLYTVHTEPPGHDPTGTPVFAGPTPTPHHVDVLTEWRLNPGDTRRGAADSRRELLRIAQPEAGNNTAWIGFAPGREPGDPEYGLLYVAVGDGGSKTRDGLSDPYQSAQNLKSPLGKILRIDPDPARTVPGYRVPADNPLTGNPEALDEIWAYGLRNPVQIAWQPGAGGRMLIADRGAANIQELNLGRPGANYGWSQREGTFTVNPANPSEVGPLPGKDAERGFDYPVVQYDRDEGGGIAGGVFYSGGQLPELAGAFVFADAVNGRLFSVGADALRRGEVAQARELAFTYNGQRASFLQVLNDDFRADLRLAVDAAGEIQLLSGRDGMIRVLGADGPVEQP